MDGGGVPRASHGRRVLQRGAALPKAILGRIVRDEAAHGTFGFTFLDWALGKMGDDGVAVVGAPLRERGVPISE